MPQNFKGRNFSRKQQKPKTSEVAIDEKSPVLRSFREYARELDDRHDRHERIVKLSRDITIESKRIIFLLHTIDERKNNKSKVLEEAEQRIKKIVEVNFKSVAKELLGQDPYQYKWAYSPGLQEFIEAYTFLEFQSRNSENDKKLSDWAALQRKMQYEEEPVDCKEENKNATNDGTSNDEEKAITITINEASPDKTNKQLSELRKFEFFIDPTEYILGLSDLTGELMRRCINSLGSGETDACMETCKVLQDFYTGYLGLNVQRCRELSRKIFTMRQSVLKTENVCYNVKVRGNEAAKWGAVFDNKPSDDVDEGFF